MSSITFKNTFLAGAYSNNDQGDKGKGIADKAGSSQDNMRYRVDSRPPDTVFQSGFKAWDPNANASLNQHLTSDRPTQYISTTSSLVSVRSFAEEYFVNSVGNKRPGYRYDISTQKIGAGIDVNKAFRSQYAANFSSENERLYEESIPASSIIGAQKLWDNSSSYITNKDSR